jgi:NhaA family Na+:H+ antiporter
MLRFVRKFLELEAAGGLVLMAAAVLALFLANSPLAPYYMAFVGWHPELAFLDLTFSLSPHFLINDGLMAVFFFMVGLEIKREIIDGELSTHSKALFPVLTALGGVIIPALVFLYFNAGTENERGWAIASATDIAFSLGILSLFGRRVPPALTVFLMALAVIDDLAAIIIIALFYSGPINFSALAAVGMCVLLLLALNRGRVFSPWPYVIIGFFLWMAVLNSGVHATMAGVILGMMIPMRTKIPRRMSFRDKMLHVLIGKLSPRRMRGPDLLSLGEHMLQSIHPWVAFGIMPLFAFTNSGIDMQNLHISQVINPLPIGIIAGLFFGKQFGIAGIAWLLVKFRLAQLPKDTNWMEFYAVSVLAGIGFTMSLFIGDLAFSAGSEQTLEMKLGIIFGSLFSTIMGCAIMAFAIQARRRKLPGPSES